MALDDPLVHLDYKLDILAAILAAILDSHDRIAKPSSRIVLQPLIIHKSGIRRCSSPSRLKVKYFSKVKTAAILDSENCSM